jgi:hypothetical protein
MIAQPIERQIWIAPFVCLDVEELGANMQARAPGD